MYVFFFKGYDISTHTNSYWTFTFSLYKLKKEDSVRFLLFCFRKIHDHSLLYILFWWTSMGKQVKQAYMYSSALALRAETLYILSLLAMSDSSLKSTMPRNSDRLCQQCLYRWDLSWDEFSTLPIFLHLQIYMTHCRPELVYKRLYRQYGQSMNKMHRLT